MSIPTDRIISRRLCLVCARDGVERPVQEHECEHEHFIATSYALRGVWVWQTSWGLRWFNPAQQWYEPLQGYQLADLWRMAVAVGGFQWDTNHTFVRANRYWLEWYEAEPEAVLRARMEQLWGKLEAR